MNERENFIGKVMVVWIAITFVIAGIVGWHTNFSPPPEVANGLMQAIGISFVVAILVAIFMAESGDKEK